MINTSEAFKVAVGQSTRATKSRVRFSVVDVTARIQAIPSASTSQPFTDIQDTLDENIAADISTGTFEDDFFRLDGSFNLMPDVPDNINLGWWSGYLSNELGVFDTPPHLIYQFEENHSSVGVKIVFDEMNRTICSEFEVVWYDLLDVELARVIVENNEDYEVNVPESVENYGRIDILFYKTLQPYRYVKMTEMVFGLEEVFNSGDIISGNIVEEVDPSSNTLSYNNMNVTVYNENQKFNMLNPEGIYAYLQSRQPISVETGLELANGNYEYVPLGVYYLSDWSNSTGITATLKGGDIISLLDRTEFISSPFWSDALFSDIINFIVQDAFPDMAIEVEISSELTAATLTGYLPRMTHREALHKVIMAVGGSLKAKRNGGLYFFKVDDIKEKDIANDVIINFPQIEQKQLITAVNVPQISYILSAVQDISKYKMAFIGEQSIVLDFPKAVHSVSSVNITGLGTIVGSPTVSASCMDIVVNATGEFEIAVSGQVYEESITVFTSRLGLLAGQSHQTAEVAPNTMLAKGANELAVYLLAYYQKRILQKFDYWSDPSIEAGDKVGVQTMFGDSYEGIVEVQEITFAPNLQAKMEVVG